MKSLLPGFLREQGYALIEPKDDGPFALLGDPPAWFTEIWGPIGTPGGVTLGEASPFLESFLEDARAFWKSGSAGVCASGTWIEQTREGKQIPLEAVALRVDGEALLSIHSPQRAFAEQSQVFQTARESMLAHERLFKEIQKKEILLHCIIHDLSQPLAAMRGCFECLAAETTPAKAKRFIDIGKQQTERQEALIREVLHTFADDLKEEMRTDSKPGGSTDLLSCARQTVVSFAPVFEAKGATITLNPKTDVGADWNVVGDESRLRRIFSNLAENALRYAPRQSAVTINLQEDGAFVHVAVEDEGPGLPPGTTPASLFALFGKGKESSGKAGLGLYFCRITIERWGGTVGCESRGAKGARFWFRLPKAATSRGVPLAAASRTPAQGNSPLREAPAAKPVMAAGLRLLLAEDQDELRQLTSYLLSKEGHQVTEARNGREALRALARQHFDVVLLDDEMPEMSGSQVVLAIRERESKKGGRQTVLGLTGNTSDEDQKRLLAAGMDSCLGKPIRLEQLRQKLAEVSHGRLAGPELATASTAQPEKLGQAELLKRVGGNARLLQQIVRTFRRDSLKKLAEMDRSLRRKDGIALATAAHALKGSASLFGSEKAKHKAQLLQDMGRREDLSQAAKVLSELKEAIFLLREELRGYHLGKGPKHGKKKRAKSQLRRKTAK
jgi:signal transduction histidine kinase/CheY-like chemotaxis protein/HPt (histidine-containing phosphotransfer) domain-containing protein